MSIFHWWDLSRTQCWCRHGSNRCLTHHSSTSVGLTATAPEASVICIAWTAMTTHFAIIAAPQDTRIIKSFRLLLSTVQRLFISVIFFLCSGIRDQNFLHNWKTNTHFDSQFSLKTDIFLGLNVAFSSMRLILWEI